MGELVAQVALASRAEVDRQGADVAPVAVVRRQDAVGEPVRVALVETNLVGERGMLHYRMGDAPRALEDLQRYASAVAPDAISAGALRLLDQLRLQFGGREEPR